MCCLQGCVWHSSSANSPSTKMWKRRTKTDGKIWDWNVTSEEHGGEYLCDKLVRTVSLSQCTHTPGVRVASGQRSSQNEQLHLLACSDVPRPVEATLHPSAFAPRRMPAPGPVADPCRKPMMWQEGENGAVTFQVQNMIFWVAHPGAPIYRKVGTMSDWATPGWQRIGTLGTEAQDAEDPKDDIPDKWAFYLADEVLLKAEVEPGRPEPEWF